MSSAPVALSGGSWILLAVLVMLAIGVIVALNTRKGSGITETPYDARRANAAPGAKGPSELSGPDEGETALDDPRRGSR